MKLYSIMLVDDEEEVRESIIKNIDWEAAGFIVVGDAENGEDALEKIEILEPNVIITDIRMPYMDGLVLAEKIHNMYPSTKIIIFSGFDDFDYAKQAIKLGVSEYILKPVNVEELTGILKRIRTSIDEEIENRTNIDILRQNYKESIPILCEQFLKELIRGRLTDADIEKGLKAYGLDIGDAKKWIVAVVDIDVDSVSDFAGEKELIPISVHTLIDEKIKDYCRYATFISIYDANIVIIAAIDNNNTQTGYINVLNDVCKESKRILEIPISIGIGNSCTKLKDIGKSYCAALDAIGYRKIVGQGEVVYINDVEPSNMGVLLFDEKDEANLISAIKFGPAERIEEILDAFINKMNAAKVHSRQNQAYMFGIVNSIIQLMQRYEISLNEVAELYSDYGSLLDRMQHTDEFRQWLSVTCMHIYKIISELRENTKIKVIEEAKEYIYKNYVNPDLSVELICRQLHMSSAYFSTLFKKETGQTYIAYLTNMRLNKAVELLKTTDDKTYLIAEKVGYPEQNYFSYVFKKKFGVSPTKFRG